MLRGIFISPADSSYGLGRMASPMSSLSAQVRKAAVAAFAARGDVRGQLHPMFIQGIAVAYRGDLEQGEAGQRARHRPDRVETVAQHLDPGARD